MTRTTHTYAILEVSERTYEEIKVRLERAGHVDRFHGSNGEIVLDMNGIALSKNPGLPATGRGHE